MAVQVQPRPFRTIPPAFDPEYPESDGQPMGETPWHRQCLTDSCESLDEHFRNDSDVYIGGNMFVYYEPGVPQRCVCPDVFTVRGIREAKVPRRVYKVWEEGRPLDWVLEITSDSTRDEDLGHKRDLYARLGVQEYFLFDPLKEYLVPRLQAFRLVGPVYEPIAPTEHGGYYSEVLGLEVRMREGNLRFFDPASQRWLLTPAETAAAHRAAEADARIARARANAAEAEVNRLREELARLRGHGQNGSGGPAPSPETHA